MQTFFLNIKNITATFIVVVLLFGNIGCQKDTPEKINLKTKTILPTLKANEITTVISDSGITKYRIYTALWNVYDKTPEPYWDFPKGVHFERFNEELMVDANVHANKAIYYQRQQLWDLRGKVRAINLLGEMFETEHLLWNQQQKRIYSDTIVKITQQTRIINAIRFESNEAMTKYSFYQLHGPMLLPE